MSTELSQARVIEYIINYQYRRQINEKSDISVLEIDPAKSDNSHLDESEVLSWIKSDTGVETKAIITGGSFCCEEIVKENTGKESIIKEENIKDECFIKLKAALTSKA